MGWKTKDLGPVVAKGKVTFRKGMKVRIGSRGSKRSGKSSRPDAYGRRKGGGRPRKF